MPRVAMGFPPNYKKFLSFLQLGIVYGADGWAGLGRARLGWARGWDGQLMADRQTATRAWIGT